ncbi:hypothetical protein Syun_027170 [Stephania yunnanensis]|uniref:FAR1 domain-containing protein n=1 Tax=Stephania yunnanensis TaxID=152371 RepID=A0AAP0ENZ0_9MAGN
MTETGATRRERPRDGKTRDRRAPRDRDGETKTTGTDVRERAPERPARTAGRRDETIERDGRLGDETIAGATRRRDGFRFLGFFRGNDLGIWCFVAGGGGMSFVSIDELLETYQDHAKEKGFAIVIRSSTKDEDGQLKYVWLSCDRGRNTYFEKHSKRVNCPAKVRAIRGGDNCWLVSKVVVEHNHERIPDLSFFIKGHRELNARMKRQLQANERANIRPSTSIRMLQIQEGGQRT